MARTERGTDAGSTPPAFPTRTGNPWPFVAEGSHGVYVRDGWYLRIGGLANDRCDRGYKWDPQNILRLFAKGEAGYVPATMGWLNYRGDMGFGHVTDLTSQEVLWSNPGMATDNRAPPRTVNFRLDVFLVILIVAVILAMMIVGIVMWKRYKKRARKCKESCDLIDKVA